MNWAPLIQCISHTCSPHFPVLFLSKLRKHARLFTRSPQVIISHTVCHTVLMMLVWRIGYLINK